MTLVQVTKLLFAAMFVAAGCGPGGTTPGHDAGAGAGGAGTGGTAGSGGTTGTTGDTCAQCVLGEPNGWDDPALVWIGDKKDAPECPIDAPKLVFTGHADLDAPYACGACTCAPSSGSCGLPSTMTANAATCALNTGSTPHTSFDPSTGWDGACDADVSVASGKLCSGVPCVKSLTIGALAMNETGCVPSMPPPTQSEPVWKTYVMACAAFPNVSCNDGQGTCLAKPPAEAGFRVCVFSLGDNDCIGNEFPPYTEKHVFYKGYDDTRSCAACTCGAPSGSACSSSVSVFTDGACSTPAYTATVTAAGPDCHDLPSGSPLGSKSATAPTYTPGACTPSGGELVGALTPLVASTYCCAPLP